jgi:hypothetical protein
MYGGHYTTPALGNQGFARRFLFQIETRRAPIHGSVSRSVSAGKSGAIPGANMGQRQAEGLDLKPKA